MKNCPTCNINPKSKGQSYCKQCHAKYQATYAKRTGYKDAKDRGKRVRQFIIDAKNKPCCDCGQVFPYFVMDFDHVRGKKQFNLSEASNSGISLERIRNEIDKCDIVCANCHRIRTFNHSGIA